MGLTFVSSGFAGGAFKKRPQTSVSKASLTAPAEMPPSKSVPLQILVALKTPLSPADREKLFSKFKLTEVERVGSTDLFLTQLPAGSTEELTDSTISKLALEAAVKYAEKNILLRTFKDGTQGGFSVQESD